MPSNPRGWDHQQTKERLLPLAYGKPCPRCGEPMLKGEDLDLGHSVDLADDPTAKGDRIEHASCPTGGGNRSAGAAAQVARDRYAPSRQW